MILTDTGPLVGMVDPADSHHTRSREVTDSLTGEMMLTTWPCFTEAMYFLGESEGFHYQMVLWDRHRNGQLLIHTPTETEFYRIEALMAQYQDTPMGLADASLIAAAESLGFDRVFSFDRDFYIYRLADGSALEVIK